MDFSLVYSGPLPASGNKGKPDDVRRIREKLSPQLARLWETHHALQLLKDQAWTPNGKPPVGWEVPSGSLSLQMGRGVLSPAEMAQELPSLGLVNLAGPIQVGGVNYTPLVRSTLCLVCELKVLFLRQGSPGQLLDQGGDLDNRIKTLLDALRVPSLDEQTQALPESQALFCLMENDTLVTGLQVTTDQLLFPETQYPNEVFLVIGVKVRVLRVNRVNAFLL